MKHLRIIVLMLSLCAVLFSSVVVNAAPNEIPSEAQMASVAAADTVSTISFKINRAPRTWSVMLQKKEWWGWNALYF